MSARNLMTPCMAIATLLAVFASAQAALLSDLLVSGATITSGDKEFSKFKWVSTVDPAQVTVSPYQDPGNLEYGLEFTSDALMLSAIGGLSAILDYRVTPTLPGRLISDNTLTMTATGGGGTSVIETPTEAVTNIPLLLSPKFTARQLGFDVKLTDHQDYLFPVLAADVNTQILLSWSGGGTLGGPKLTRFTETFSQIPEPASVALVGLATLGLGLFGRRRRRA